MEETEIVEAGRVLSAANEKKLRSAILALDSVLAALLKPDATQKESLQESFNVGEWVESRIHLYFTEMTDNMFGYGNLTRDERITLSGGIGAALDAFRTKIEADAPQLYQRMPGADPDDDGDPGEDAPEVAEATQPIAEAATDVEITESEMVIDLVEKAIRSDGTMPVKLIQPGWGSSGYYPADVLKRDGPKVFAKGLQLFWDHQTAVQEAEQPEGSLNNLAGVLINDATWQENGKAGPGLYADAKVFKAYQEAVNEMAPHIGLSIRASGKASQGEASGRKGAVIQEITSAKSTDFVTKAGAGGQIISMFEAARNGKQSNTPDNGQSTTPLQESGQVQPATGQRKTTMANEAREVNMADLGDVEAKLAEAARKVEQYDRILVSLQDIQAKLKESDTSNARLREAMLVRDAKEFVAKELEGKQLPEPTRKRLQESLTIDPPIVDGAIDQTTYAMRVREAVKTETDYLAAVAGYSGSGHISGMGGASVVNQDNGKRTQARLNEAFAGLGLSEQELKFATRVQ